MQKSDFSKWDLDKLDATFGLQAVSTHPVLAMVDKPLYARCA
jgi:hypothetical protein